MISFAETVLNTKPNKLEEENIIPYTYEETVMCIYEYGECYRNLNKELTLFSEADGTDNPGKIQRAIAWLRKMWAKFVNWLKRVFGFVNVNSEVDPEVAKNAFDTEMAKMRTHSAKIKPLIQEVDDYIKASEGKPNCEVNTTLYDNIIKGSTIIGDIIKDTVLFKKGKTYVESIFSERGHICVRMHNHLNQFASTADARNAYQHLVDVISKTPQNANDINTAFLALFCNVTNKYDGKTIRTIFDIQMVKPTYDDMFIFELDVTYSEMFEGILSHVFDDVPMADVVRKMTSYKITTDVDNVYSNLRFPDLEVEGVPAYMAFIDAMTSVYEYENASRTTGFLMHMFWWVTHIATRLDYAVGELNSSDN